MFKIKIASYSKLVSPYKTDNHKIYDFFINVKNIPKGLPTKVNPRKVKTSTKVYKAIKSGLINDNHSFYLDNRGLFITARGVHIHNDILYLDLGNYTKQSLNLYGVVDGGHTYHAIIHNRGKIARDKNVYVHMEVVTGVSNIVELAKDRNTNVQVQDKAIANLAGKFDPIKKVLSGTRIAPKVSYTQNESKREKPIDVLKILQLLFAITYNDKNNIQPVAAYNSRNGVLKNYLEHPSKYTDAIKHVPTLLKLYDFIQINIKNAYKVTHAQARLGMYQGFGNNGKLRPTTFQNYECHYDVSPGIIIPIFAGLRYLFNKNIHGYYWEVDPFKTIKSALPSIVSYIAKKDVLKDKLKIRLGRIPDVYVNSYLQVKLHAVLLEK